MRKVNITNETFNMRQHRFSFPLEDVRLCAP